MATHTPDEKSMDTLWSNLSNVENSNIENLRSKANVETQPRTPNIKLEHRKKPGAYLG